MTQPIELNREFQVSEGTEARILDAAERVFAKRGLAGTRVREIAEAAGVNAATLYLYFESKEALYRAVLDHGVRPVLELLGRFRDAPPEAAAVEELMVAVMRHLGERPYLSRLVYLEAISEGAMLPYLARVWLRPLFEHVARLLEAGPVQRWEREDYPALIATFFHLTFGHFSLAPLLRETLDRDPASPEGVERQARFVIHLIRRMFPELREARGAAEE